ncbi:MAG: hypothetical protein JNG84_04925 [Archangium sp.]|nr:hypothetical protein [Archangium sp.]
MSPLPEQNVVVVIDDDRALCELLAELIRAPDRQVDTFDQVEGLTPELIALSQPRLVVMNPRVAGLSEAEVRKLVLGVRELTGARFVLMISEDDAERSDELMRALGADGAVPIRALLRDPLQALVTREAAAAALQTATGARLSDLGADDILNLEFDVGPPAAPPRPAPGSAPSTFTWAPLPTLPHPLPPPAPSPPLAPAKPKPQVAATLQMVVDEELQRPRESQPAHLQVPLDTLSESNLVMKGAQAAGVFVILNPLPAVGTKLKVTLSFPWGAKVEADGVVAWHQADNPLSKRRRTGVGVSLPSDKTFSAAATRFAYLRRPMSWPAGVA